MFNPSSSYECSTASESTSGDNYSSNSSNAVTHSHAGLNHQIILNNISDLQPRFGLNLQFASDSVPASSYNEGFNPNKPQPIHFVSDVAQPVISTALGVQHARHPVNLLSISNNFAIKTCTNPDDIGQNVPVVGISRSVPMVDMGQNVPVAGIAQSVPMAGMGQNVPVAGIAQSAPMAGIGQNVPVAPFQVILPDGHFPFAFNTRQDQSMQGLVTDLINRPNGHVVSALPQGMLIQSDAVNPFDPYTNKLYQGIQLPASTCNGQNHCSLGFPFTKSSELRTEDSQNLGTVTMVNDTSVVSMDTNNVKPDANETCCDVTGDASSLVIASVVGGSEAKKISEMCENSPEDEELCLSGGFIQNVVVQGDQLSFTAQSVQLEVRVEGEIPVNSDKAVTTSNTSDLDSLDNVQMKEDTVCSSSDNKSLYQVTETTVPISGNTRNIAMNAHKETIKKEPLWSSSITQSVSSIPCHVVPQIEPCNPTFQLDEETKIPATASSTANDAMRFSQSISVGLKQSCCNTTEREPQDLVSVDTHTSKGPSDRIFVQDFLSCYAGQTENVPESKLSVDPLACPVCGVSLSRVQVLKRHLHSHYGFDPYACRKCNKVFSNAAQLEQHMSVHKGIKQFVCIHCDKSFILKINLSVHLQCHVENSLKDLLCCICDKEFESFQPLVNHLDSHTDAQSLTCRQCGQCLPTGVDLLIHTRVHDNQRMNRDAGFGSKICLKNIPAETHPNHHSRSHGSRDTNDATSDVAVCAEDKNDVAVCAEDKNDVTSDVAVDAEDTNDVITNVTMSADAFHKEAGTIDHRSGSIGKSNLSCSVCGQTFTKRTDLMAHRFQHVGEKDKDRKYECEECGAKFKKSWHLKEHKRRHTDIKFYACTVCGMRFRRSNQMTKHRKTTHE